MPELRLRSWNPAFMAGRRLICASFARPTFVSTTIDALTVMGSCLSASVSCSLIREEERKRLQ